MFRYILSVDEEGRRVLEPGGPGLASYQYLPELSLRDRTRSQIRPSVVMTGQTQGEHTGDIYTTHGTPEIGNNQNQTR